jgi:hypothetical protein
MLHSISMKKLRVMILFVIIAMVASSLLKSDTDERRLTAHEAGDSIDIKKLTCSERKRRRFTIDMSYTVRYRLVSVSIRLRVRVRFKG